MNPSRAIICTVLLAFQGERTVSGVLHLLNGKKSVQTIQDGSFFNVLRYFGTFPKLERKQLEEELHQLEKDGDIIYSNDRAYVTKQGETKIKTFIQKWPNISILNGWNYHLYTDNVWLRLCLFVQVVSNVVIGNNRFYPITHRLDIQQWVKKNVPNTKEERKEKLAQLYKELYAFFSTCDEKDAFVLVHQLTGANKVGLTIEQLAHVLHVDRDTIYFIHLLTLHKLFYTLEKNGSDYPLLSTFLFDLKREVVLTESAEKTYAMLRRGATIEQISKRRNLKENTIEDHIVEIVWQDPQFSIRPFVDERTERLIKTVSDKLKTSRLRELKEELPDDVTYFMIRLVLAKEKVGRR